MALTLLVLFGVLITVVVIANSCVLPRGSMVRTAVLVGSGIAIVRLSLFGAGLGLYAREGQPQQVVAGYVLLILNSPIEIQIATTLTRGAREPSWPLLVSALIVLTSGAGGWVWAVIRFGMNRRDGKRQ